jgi:para-nitrobenzyl esterase
MRECRLCLSLAVLAVLIGVPGCAFFPVGTDTLGPTAVQTASGMLRGERVGQSLSFKGIPYAQPPVGELRWRSPRPAAAWEGVRPANAYSPNCMQLDNDVLWFELGEISEDCLYLNVWTPAAANAQDDLPVMVWIHGGGYVNGSGNTALLNSPQLAERGVVLVTFNYRLSAFGFMTHPALAAANPEEPNGNYGLQDVLLALQWVRDNIKAFGGDPNNVTIFGESAGAGLVNTLLVAPNAGGLFHRAISQSSSVGLAPEPYPDRRAGFQPPSDKGGQALARKAGIADYKSADVAVADALRALEAEDLLGLIDYRDRFTPVVDGRVLPDQVGVLFAAGAQHPVPYITGTVSWEASLGRSIGGPFSPENLSRIIPEPDKQRLYPGLTGAELEDAVFGDIVVFAASDYVAGHMAAKGVDVYRFYMTYVASDRRKTQPGVAHQNDIAFVFGTLDAEADLKAIAPQDTAVSNLMQSYWVQFARTGNPNAPDLPRWPRTTGTAAPVLELGDEIRVHEAFYTERMRYHIARSQKLLERSR